MPDEIEVATVVTDGVQDLVPRQDPVDPVVLAQAIRYIQQRIPDPGGLTLRQRQSLARAASLDPEIIDTGLSLGSAWPDMKRLVDASADEARAELDRAREWEEVERALDVLTATVRASNLKRKHRIGTIVLAIYSTVGRKLQEGAAGYEHLVPYYEQMKRIFLRLRGKRKTTKDDEGAG